MTAVLAVMYASAIIFTGAFLFTAVVASPSSSNAPSSPRAEWQLPISCCPKSCSQPSVWVDESLYRICGPIMRGEASLKRALARQRNGETLTAIAKSYNVSTYYHL